MPPKIPKDGITFTLSRTILVCVIHFHTLTIVSKIERSLIYQKKRSKDTETGKTISQTKQSKKSIEKCQTDCEKGLPYIMEKDYPMETSGR